MNNSSQYIIGVVVVALMVIMAPFLLLVALLLPVSSGGQHQGGAVNAACLPVSTGGNTLSGSSTPTGTAATLTPTPVTTNGCIGNQAIVQAALSVVTHLHGDPDVNWDADMPKPVTDYWSSHCPSGSQCWSDWQNGNLQCVQLVTGTFALAGAPLPAAGDAIDFWSLYAGLSGWSEALSYTVPRHLPLPGDIMVWSGPTIAGHVAIVTDVVLPANGNNGSITFAEANGPGSIINGQFVAGIVTQTLAPDLEVATWSGSQVVGYIRPNSVYVDLAANDAQAAGIDPTLFIRQIQVESSFNPDAISSKGAVGIAQFLLSTAANLNPPIDPTDPVASLSAAAQYMATESSTYGGDYAKALAAYNAGDKTVQDAVKNYGTLWLSHMPPETINYVNSIINS